MSTNSAKIYTCRSNTPLNNSKSVQQKKTSKSVEKAQKSKHSLTLILNELSESTKKDESTLKTLSHVKKPMKNKWQSSKLSKQKSIRRSLKAMSSATMTSSISTT